MTVEEIRKELEEKIKELERKTNLKSLEIINWINGLLAKLPKEEVKVEEVKEVKVVVPTKKKISFKKK